MKLHECDPSLVDGKRLPQAFLATIYVPNELMALLDFDPADEEHLAEFWHLVRDGIILPPVFLPTNTPCPVWDRETADDWIGAGTPVPAHVVRHQLSVNRRLIEAVTDELPTSPLRASERN